MSKLIVKMLERGPYMKIVISVIRVDGNFSEITTKPININNMASVNVKLQAVSKPNYYLGVTMQFKKGDNVKNALINLNINSDEYNKDYFCNDEWVEVALPSKVYDSFLKESSPYTMLYIIEMKITVNEVISQASNVFDELYKEKEDPDFNLLAADGVVAVHKSVLYVQSEMFRTMLKGNWKETDEDGINMPGVTKETLQHLKDYMYLGNLPDEGLGPLLVLAKRCLMAKLVDACIKKLVETVKPETFDAVVELACQNNIPELVKGLFSTIPDSIINSISQLNIK